MKKIEFGKYIAEIKRNPGKIFGLVYIYIFTIGMAAGIYYIQNLSAIERQNIPPGIPDTTAKQDLKVIEAKIIPPVNIKDYENPGQQVLDKGKNLYNSVCASCHGPEGKGDGPAGVALTPPARNFTSKEGWKNGNGLQGIYKTLEEGIPGTGMISYNYMPPDEKLSIAQYLRKTFVPDAQPVANEELIAIDQTYNLSKGTEMSAQIPVVQAMDLYLTENKGRTDKIINSMRELSASETEGGKVIRKIVSDRTKAITALTMNKDWMKDKNKLKGLITYGVNRNGFSSNAYYLSEDEWSILHEYLLSIF